jgi:uncharacterized phage protein (TIGR01671 family)
MEREIKLRAWDGERMIYRNLFDRSWYSEEMGGKVICGIHPDDKTNLKVTLNTGLHDKNGVEIYFGDVCERDEWIAGKKVKTMCIIEYSIDRFISKWITDTMYNDSLRYHYEHLEVIGNLYQNPELLK